MTASRRRRWLCRLGLLVLAVLVLGGCAADAPMDTFEPAGPDARRIDDLIRPVFAVAGVVLMLVIAATVYMLIRFRARAGRDAGDRPDLPEQIHGNTRLEIGWTVVPAVILAVISVFTVATVYELYDREDETALDVVVVGNQWWWEYRYYFDGFDPSTDHDPEINPQIEDVTDTAGKTVKEADLVTSTQLVVPAGRTIQLQLTSRDVIHSHWMPTLNGKRDAVPGRIQPWRVEADEPGVYFGQCTEFCGLSHSRMRMQVVALDEDEFAEWVDQVTQPAEAPSDASQRWLEQQKELAAGEEIPEDELVEAPADTAAERGLVLFRGQCSRCHLAEGINEDIYEGADQVSGAAPNLTFFANRTTYAGGIFDLYEPDGEPFIPQLRAWLRNPPAEKDMDPDNNRGMPNLGLNDDQIDDLIAFLLTLGPPPSPDVVAATEVS